MNNTKYRIISSLAFSIVFYLIWFLYDIIVYLNINNENLIVMTILFSIIDLVLLLFVLFLMKNEYRIISEKVNNYISVYFIVHTAVSILNILINTASAKNIFLLGILIICIGIIITFYIANKIYEETIILPKVEEYSKILTVFQDAIVTGASTLMLASFMIGEIFFCGKSIITIFVMVPFIILTVLCSFIKQRLISSYKIISKFRIASDNLLIIVAALISFYFSNSDMLVPNSIDKSMKINFVGFIICFLPLIPLIKTNKKIGFEANKFRNKN